MFQLILGKDTNRINVYWTKDANTLRRHGLLCLQHLISEYKKQKVENGVYNTLYNKVHGF
jgi:hypothetical protein